MISHKFRTAFAVTMAILMLTTPALGAANLSPVDRVSPSVSDAVDPLGYSVPDKVARYGDASTPGLFVSVESSEDLDSLHSWANSSDQRLFIKRYENRNVALISAPMSDVKPTLTDTSRWNPVGDETISSLGYVNGIAFDLQVSYAEPIRTLESNDSFTKPPGAKFGELVTGATYSADAMAWESDANKTNLTRVRKLHGVDEVSDTGDGVNVAVIDSGVNFANGSLFGNGTAGSDMRVVDAHDFVQEESVNLSVSRGNLSDELDAVQDPNGHGTHVASTVANAESGMAPGANLMAYRALNKEGEGSTSDIRDAIARADSQGADIIVMSLGSPIHSDALANELRRALGENGNVTGVFIAAGNSYTTTRYVSSPSDVDGVISVTATNPANASTAKKAYFANIGPDTGLDGSGTGELDTQGEQPDTAAVGMKVRAPVADTDGNLFNATKSGTSMAAPVAAGVGALLLDSEPTLKGEPAKFRTRIVESGAHTPNIGLTESRGGMVNASRAINGYDGDNATNRKLTEETKNRDKSNRYLSGDVGMKMARLDEWSGILS